MGRLTEYFFLFNNPGKTKEWIKQHIFWCPLTWEERKNIDIVEKKEIKNVPKDIFEV